MAKTIRTAGSREIPHDKCGKAIARIENGVPHVQCTRQRCKDWVPLAEFVEVGPIREVIDLMLSGKVNPADVIALSNPFARYRQINGLFVVGPEELDKVFRTGVKGNPLDLNEGWIPEPPVIDEWLDAWIQSCIWRDNSEWNTRAALVLVPRIIGGVPTSLVGQNHLLGVAHDERQAGIVRSDVFWSNWFVKPNPDWANEPATTSWRWVLVYEHPCWTTRKNWSAQQQVAQEKGMTILSAAQDVWALNVVRAVYDVSFRLGTYSRVNTIYDGFPLGVRSYGDGVYVCQYWSPSSAYGDIGLSVQGVPSDFVS